jgi:hypothetical protein
MDEIKATLEGKKLKVLSCHITTERDPRTFTTRAWSESVHSVTGKPIPKVFDHNECDEDWKEYPVYRLDKRFKKISVLNHPEETIFVGGPFTTDVELIVRGLYTMAMEEQALVVACGKTELFKGTVRMADVRNGSDGLATIKFHKVGSQP